MQKTRLVAAWLGIAAMLFYFGHYLHRAWSACHPPRTRVTAEQRAEAARLLPGMRDVEFDGASGVKLRGWFSPPANGSVVVYVHGLEGNRASLLPEAETLARHGYGALLFDARAHGESSGDAATWGYVESEDVKRAIDFALTDAAVKHVVVLGFSVGGTAVARAAAADPRAAAIILYATWTSLHEEIAYKAGFHAAFARLPLEIGYRLSGVDVAAVKPVNDVPHFSPRPFLMVEGLADKDTPPPVMEHLFSVAGDPKTILRVPGAGHGEVFQVGKAEWEHTVVAFLSRALGGEVTAARFPR